MMRALGRPVGQCRLPVGPAPDGLEARALEVFERLRPS
jgi:4-hydroxy-tetrahydrodipicolinate synthase